MQIRIKWLLFVVFTISVSTIIPMEKEKASNTIIMGYLNNLPYLEEIVLGYLNKWEICSELNTNSEVSCDNHVSISPNSVYLAFTERKLVKNLLGKSQTDQVYENIKLLNLLTGRIAYTLQDKIKNNNFPIATMMFSPDSTKLMFLSSGKLREWDFIANTSKTIFQDHAKYSYSAVAIAPNNQYLACGYCNDNF